MPDSTMMETALTLLEKNFNPSIDHPWKGFTLIELLISLLITGIIVLVAGIGLINLLFLNQNVEIESKQRLKLNRALAYISNDLRDSRATNTSSPLSWSSPAGYTAIFYLEKPYNLVNQTLEDPLNDKDNVVGYYIKRPAKSEGWKLDQVIYRVYFNGSNYVIAPVVDGITNSPPSTCLGTGTQAGSRGFQVYLDGNKVKLCLQGITDAARNEYEVESVVAMRNF